MKNFVTIGIFTLLVSLFYTAVGQVLPQLPSIPPQELKLGEKLSADDLVAAGAGVFDANCLQCHKIGRTDRCPDLAGMGLRAKERAAVRGPVGGRTLDDVDFLLESLCRPGDYLTPGYEAQNIMPPQGKQLTGGQMIGVTAFLQDQGGAVTVSLADARAAEERLARFGCVAGAGGAAAAPVAAAPVGSPEQVFTTFGCGGCHFLDRPDKSVGPSLADVGKRLDRGALYESLLTPDASLAAGFPGGLMKATLDGNGFYERMTPADYKALVDWLAGHRG
jgi:cytochrome c2